MTNPRPSLKAVLWGVGRDVSVVIAGLVLLVFLGSLF